MTVSQGLTETATEFEGLFLVNRWPVHDDRGSFERVFCFSELKSWKKRKIAQVNRTMTRQKGVIRGLHFQYPPYAEAKYVCCVKGVVFDVVIDLRFKSDSYGNFFMTELDSSKHQGIFIPEGFAHGFQTMTREVEMLYFHSNDYRPEYESGVNAFDSSLVIPWPGRCTKISKKDEGLPEFKSLEAIKL